MKKIVEDSEGGLVSYLGENILVFAANYIYTGKLEGVNSTCILLRDPKIVYETGSFTEAGYTDAQILPKDTAYIMLSAIEMVCHSK